MSDSECYPKAYFSRKPNFPNCGFNTRHDSREVTLIEFFESRICPNIYRMFRSVDWTQDMIIVKTWIIVKWHLFIWHERKLCALTNAPPIQSTQMTPWLSTLFYANYSAAQFYVLYPPQFIFALSCRPRSFFAAITIHWARRKIFCRIICVCDDDKCYGENMS